MALRYHSGAPRSVRSRVNADDGVHGRELWVLDPGAAAQRLGTACTSTVAPTLEAMTPPILGRQLRLDVVQPDTKTGSRGVLVWGALPSRPAYLGNGCTVYVDIAKPFQPVPFVPDKTGRWSLTARIPNVPALHGILVSVQAAAGPTGSAPLGLDLTNGLLLSVRR